MRECVIEQVEGRGQRPGAAGVVLRPSYSARIGTSHRYSSTLGGVSGTLGHCLPYMYVYVRRVDSFEVFLKRASKLNYAANSSSNVNSSWVVIPRTTKN
ncbi:hypothetical protein HAX54_006436, partial [Datura stramonium]|nr:hypothetical protein [Datura stramonium]